ncbi:unnamed protein product [Boreogadus saida]
MTMESQRDDAVPFPMVRRSSLSRTSAEIVKEARQSLRSLSTKRPHTPRDGARQLFGGNYVWSDVEARPPSTFSIHALSFDAPDSRPASGTRLSPIDRKPRLRVTETGEELARAHPRPPTEPPDAKRGLQSPLTALCCHTAPQPESEASITTTSRREGIEPNETPLARNALRLQGCNARRH